MNPVIALVGRPNVGKSTLFNRLTRSRDALVADFPGLTRDRQYGNGQLGGKEYTVIDTGGISGDEQGIDAAMAEQSLLAIDEADIVADIRKRAGTVFHASCTCRMGPDPETAVVDNRLRVHGLEGLRVVDASVFPYVTSGNTNAPTIMVGEKGADLVLADASGK